MDLKKGDRFRHEWDDQGQLKWVIYEYFNEYQCVVVSSNDLDFWPTDGVLKHWVPDGDEYLGNYSKINNFEALYNLLDGEDR